MITSIDRTDHRCSSPAPHDIAERLSVSPRTVDVHLNRIDSKLGIDSKAALVRLMAVAG
ncbi:LuxR C-terminal-related transcriptional regulator [Streptomyces sp. NPDC001393]